MSNFMNKCQLVKAYNNGLLDDVKTQLIRYGTIHSVTDSDKIDGAHRCYQIQHHNMLWTVKMHNGEVKSVTYVR